MERMNSKKNSIAQNNTPILKEGISKLPNRFKIVKKESKGSQEILEKKLEANLITPINNNRKPSVNNESFFPLYNPKSTKGFKPEIVSDLNDKLVLSLENEIKLLKNRVNDQEKQLREKNRVINEHENYISKITAEYDDLRSKNSKLKDKINRMKLDHRQNQPETETQSSSTERLVRISNIGSMLSEMRNFLVSVQENYDTQIINQLCPNPDEMSYEEILALQDQMGYVSRGLSNEDIEKIPIVQFNKLESIKRNSPEMCTICLVDFNHKERIKQLKCSHHFHSNCLQEWLHGKTVCPLCKENAK